MECTIKWRSSGGRGEYEFSPADSLLDRVVVVRIDQFGIDIPAEVSGKYDEKQGKPRVRKFDPNNRGKLHLVPLVLAIARLPSPIREDKDDLDPSRLQSKGFVVSEMDFDITFDDGRTVILRPLRARILHAEHMEINLQERFLSISRDFSPEVLGHLHATSPALAFAVERHQRAVFARVNSAEIDRAAAEVIAQQMAYCGDSNLSSISTVLNLPTTPLEDDLVGVEGRVLVRLHSYRERDRRISRAAKDAFKLRHGKLFCECCGFDPLSWYGPLAEDRIHVHHRIPIAEALPDTQTRIEDLAMVCPTCHDFIHSFHPCMDVETLHTHLMASGNHHFHRHRYGAGGVMPGN